MPPEPKKPIEELLEATAKARRAEFGAASKMPNPMRAQLHTEIARQARAEEPAPRRGWLAMFWPQLSVATAVAAVLVTAAVFWLEHRSGSSHESMQLAMQAPPSAPAETVLKSLDATQQPLANAAPPLTPMLPNETSVAGRLAENSAAMSPPVDVEAKGENDTTTLEKFADVASAPAASGIAAPGGAQIRAEDLKDQVRATARTDESNRPATKTAVHEPADKSASAPAIVAARPSQNQRSEANNLQQQFSQTPRGLALRNNANLKRSLNILEAFQVEQDGQKIRVVDADGSTYTGKIEPVAQNEVRKKEQAPAAAAPSAMRAAKPQEANAGPNEQFSFRASGYNNSLRKRVVFEGNYIPLPAQSGQAPAQQQAYGVQQTAARIVGKATVPGEAPVEVDAITTVR